MLTDLWCNGEHDRSWVQTGVEATKSLKLVFATSRLSMRMPEILLKVALNTINQTKPNLNMYNKSRFTSK